MKLTSQQIMGLSWPGRGSSWEWVTFAEAEKQQQGRRMTAFNLQEVPLVLCHPCWSAVEREEIEPQKILHVCSFILVYLFLFAAVILETRKKSYDHHQWFICIFIFIEV